MFEVDEIVGRRVSATLQALAPHHAHQIAALMAFPHSVFFTLSPARIHLVGLCLLGIDEQAMDVRVLNAKRWHDAVKVLSDPGPIGIEGVLAKMTLPMWSPEDYRRLWGLIGCSNALNYLRHAAALEPHHIAVLSELPPILRHDNIVRHIRRPLEARVLVHGFSDEKIARLLLQAGKQSESRNRFFGKAARILVKTRKFAVAPDIRHDCIVPIRTPAELRQVALRFGNCLRDYVDKASAGEVAFYVYEGEEPAVVMISPRVAGVHVLDQMLGVNNRVLTGATRKIIRDAFGSIGIGDRSEEARRKAMDYCLSALRLVQLDAGEEIDRYCLAFFNQIEVAELPDHEFWPFW